MHTEKVSFNDCSMSMLNSLIIAFIILLDPVQLESGIAYPLYN
jgi:hypothetical protein